MDRIRVVLVEDHGLTRMGLRTTLQQSSIAEVVGEAEDGIEGLKLLQASKPDVAIVDIGLPGIDGIDLTKQFRQAQADAETLEGDLTRTKIMILTMQNSENAVLAAFAAGADSYCMKDSSTGNLLQALQSTYEGGSWIDPAIARIVLHHNKQQARNVAGAPNPTVAIGSDDEYGHLLEVSPLTSRELEVLELIVAGCSNEDIASRLYITVGTVKTHVRNILNKLCADDRTQAAVRALRCGLVA